MRSHRTASFILRRTAIVCGLLATALPVRAPAGESNENETSPAGDEWKSDEEWLDALVLGEDSEWDPTEPAADDEGSESAAPVPSKAELEATLKELTGASYEGTFEFSGGWKQNALLSEDGSVDSGFEQVTADLFGLRPELGSRWELLGIFYGEYRHYDSVPDLESEYLAVARGQAAHSWGNGFRSFGNLSGVASKQAFDASLVDFETATETVTYRSPEIGVGLEKSIDAASKAGVDFALARSSYNVHSEDFDRATVGLGYDRAIGSQSRLKLRVEGYKEGYDERLARMASGPIENAPLLELKGQRFEAEWRYARSDGQLRQLRTKFAYETEDDPVGDYYERDKWELRQTANWSLGDWQVEGSVAYGDIGYDARLARPDDTATRSDSSWRLEGQLTRDLSDRLRAFLGYEWVDKDSNAPDYSYDSQTVKLGLSWIGFQQD